MMLNMANVECVEKSWRDANAKESHLRARLTSHTVKEVKLELLHPATKII